MASTFVATAAAKKRQKMFRPRCCHCNFFPNPFRFSTYGIFLVLIAIATLSSFRIHYYFAHYCNDLQPQPLPQLQPRLSLSFHSATKTLPDASTVYVKKTNAFSTRPWEEKADPVTVNITKIRKRLKATKPHYEYIKEHLKLQKRFVAKQMTVLNVTEAEAKKLFVNLENDNDYLHHTENNDKDPWFVLHIGPPKTATTTIQCGLEKHALRLAKTDGYHFLGGGCGRPMTTYFMPNGEETVKRRQLILGLHHLTNDENSVSVKHSAKDNGYLAKFVARAKYLRQHGRSVILSSELFGSRLSAKKSVMRLAKSMLVSSADGAGFSPERTRIVLAYRHFIDWLPSFYYQTYLISDNLMDPMWLARSPQRSRVKSFLEFSDEYLGMWEDHKLKMETHLANATFSSNDSDIDIHDERNGQQAEKERLTDGNHEDDYIETGNPLNFLPMDRFSMHPTWWLYQLWSSYFPLKNQVQVYDMHSRMNSNRPNDDMVTDFICHVLPSANKTCSKLMHMEDERKCLDGECSNFLSTASNMIDASSGGDNYLEPDYDNPQLHSQYSYLNLGRKVRIRGVSDTLTNADGGNNADLGTNIRPSADHHATRIIEELLIQGDIRDFEYTNYGASYFESAGANATSPDVIRGYTKGKLVQIANDLLREYGIYSADSVKPFSERFSDKYFDCMPKDLEDRLLRASSTFMDLMYKHTALWHSNATADTATEDEREHGWIEAQAKHFRIFEKSKAKGKYCDINPGKVFSESPALYETLASLSYKPSYRFFYHEELPKHTLEHLDALNFTKRGWDARATRKRNMPKKTWKNLTPGQQAAAFALGWDRKLWNMDVRKLR